jgi:hypothetical protein
LCWWRDARWEDRGVLRVPGTGEPYARARALGSQDAWKGARTTGVLRRVGPVVLLQGEWSGPGVTLKADVDVGADAVFRAYETTRLGAAGVLLSGAPVRLTDAREGQVLALPTEEALSLFSPTEVPALDLTCEGLSLYAPSGPSESPRATLARLGWTPLSAGLLSAQREFPLTDVPGGSNTGQFNKRLADETAWVVATEGTQSRVAVIRDGLVWVGWLASDELKPAPGMLMGSSSERPDRPRASLTALRQCDEDLPLSVAIEGTAYEVGTLHRGTSFSVQSSWGDAVVVRPQTDWLRLVAQVEFLAPLSAARCPTVKQAPVPGE